MISVFYFIGLWNGDHFTARRKLATNLWFIGIYGLFTISTVGGAFQCDDDGESKYLANVSIITFVTTVRSYYLLWKKDEILEFIHTFGAHSIKNNEDFKRVNKKVNKFVQFICFFEVMVAVGIVSTIVLALPIVCNEKRLPLNVYIPFDWKENEVIYWMTYLISSYQMMLSVALALFNFIIWYLMMSCGIKYQLLGNEFREMGFVHGESVRNIIVARNQELFLKELLEQIKYHRHLQKYK